MVTASSFLYTKRQMLFVYFTKLSKRIESQAHQPGLHQLSQLFVLLKELELAKHGGTHL